MPCPDSTPLPLPLQPSPDLCPPSHSGCPHPPLPPWHPPAVSQRTPALTESQPAPALAPLPAGPPVSLRPQLDSVWDLLGSCPSTGVTCLWNGSLRTIQGFICNNCTLGQRSRSLRRSRGAGLGSAPPAGVPARQRAPAPPRWAQAKRGPWAKFHRISWWPLPLTQISGPSTWVS